MSKITHSLIFVVSLTVLFACSEPTNTSSSADTTTTTETVEKHENLELPIPAEQPKIDVSNLDLSLPSEAMADQKIHIPNEQPLMPELFNQEKTPAKYQLGGQVFLDEEQRLGVEALDGAEISITITK